MVGGARAMKSIPPSVRRVLWAQAGVGLLLALAFGLRGPAAGWSALLGGGICVASNVFLAWRMFARPAPAALPGTVRDWLGAEMGKWILTGGLFAAVFLWVRPVDALALLVTFGLSTVVGALFAGPRDSVKTNRGN